MYTNPFNISGFSFGSNPLTDLERTLEMQLSSIREMARQAPLPQQGGDAFDTAVRSVVDRYMQEREQGTVPQPMQAVTAAIEASMTPENLQFLANNISSVPEYLRSQEGKDILSKMIDGMRQKVGENSSGTSVAVAAESRPAT